MRWQPADHRIREEIALALDITEPTRHVALITIDNQAKRNALTRDDMATLGATWDRLGGG